MFILHRLLAVGFSLAFAASVFAAPNRPLVPRRPRNALYYVRGFHPHRHHARHRVHRRVLPIYRRFTVPTVRRHFSPVVKRRPAWHRPAHRARHHRR